jgi:uncharacterized protein (DUF302 family)
MGDYGRRLIVERPFDRTLWLVIEAFVREGFSMKSTDVTRMVRRIAHRDLRRYILLEATHPDLTWKALQLDLDAGVLVPCHIAIYELGDGQTVVTVADPLEAVTSLRSYRETSPELAAVAEAIENRVARALGAISRGGPSYGQAA